MLQSDARRIHLPDPQARKVYPPDRKVLEDVSLSFFHGAKIGVLGYNGAGKSSLLAIMAGATASSVATRSSLPGQRRVARPGAEARSRQERA